MRTPYSWLRLGAYAHAGAPVSDASFHAGLAAKRGRGETQQIDFIIPHVPPLPRALRVK